MVKSSSKKSGALSAELMVAMAIFVIAMLPLAGVLAQEQKFARDSYHRAIAMELIDGEMEILMAGEWHSFHQGAQPYSFHADCAANLPPGNATLTITGRHLRLDWQPEKRTRSGTVVREADAR
jgi:Tfp pilus assembly protein PilV